MENGIGSISSLQPSFFLGRYVHNLDPKKRLTIPSGWRDCLGNPKYTFILPDPSLNCLNIVPYEELNLQLQKLKEKSFFDSRITAALQMIGSNSEQVSLDVQGRIRISDRLLEYAGLVGKVVLIGAVNRIQIWSQSLAPSGETVDAVGLKEAFNNLSF